MTRSRLPGPGRDSGTRAPVLTNVRKGGIVLPFPSGLASEPGRPLPLTDDEWASLVERLLKLSENDLETLVLAVRLHRRFEEENRARE